MKTLLRLFGGFLGMIGLVFMITDADAMVSCDSSSVFAKGADVSWLTQLESEGVRFYTTSDSLVEKECMQLLKEDCGVNSIRLRVWVDPTEKWNGLEDVLVKSQRADSLGLRLMIDFHLSDTWADPGHQNMPESWKNLPFQDLKDAMYDHIVTTLDAHKEKGINVEWIQVGNETTPGMMFPVGSMHNPKELGELYATGYDAVKSVYPEAKVIIHLDGGEKQAQYDFMFDLIEENGGKYDMIGMSLYPFWATQSGEAGNWESVADKCISNISHLKEKYGKPIMICEIGMRYDEGEECRRLIEKMMKADVDGIFYWEPEAPEGYNGGYDMGCFEHGVPNAALNAFK